MHQPNRWRIDDEKLAEIIRQYRTITGDTAVDDEVIDTLLNYDWDNESEHQSWLDTAPAAEIANWLSHMLFGQE